MTGPRIVVAGAGPVGLMTAALLVADRRMFGCELRIVERAARKVWHESEVDLRVYALSRASQALFESLGLWRALAARRLSPYRTMRVWQGADPRGPASVTFDSATIGEPDLGHIVEDSLLRQVLLEYLAGSAGVRIDFETPIVAFERGARRLKVRTAGGEEIRADLLVGADGARSRVRELAGIASCTRNYRQRALVVHVTSARPHDGTAWQRFGDLGPLALLPLADGRSSIVWSVPEAEARRLVALDDGAFEAALDEASAGVLGRLTPSSERVAFPLRLMHAARYTDRSLALIGDAAHTVHPLAGQGMNLGLLDAAALVEVVAAAVESGEHVGDRYVLDRYARARRGHNLRMQLGFDGLDRLFRADGVVRPLRAAGMLAVDALPVVKQLLIGEAMANGHRRPRHEAAAGPLRRPH